MSSPTTIMGEYSPAAESAELERRKQMKEEEETKNHPINVNGHALTLGDMYSSHYDRKDMMTKLKLLDSKAGGANATAGDTGEPDDSPVEDQLFGGGKAKAKPAMKTDGEPDMEPTESK